MTRTLPLFLLLFPLAATAQFGPQHFAFVSDLNYPTRIYSGDVDGDGDLDALVCLNNTMLLFTNDGTGHFSEPLTAIASVSVGSGTPCKVVDLDNDGDGDVVLNGSFYRNDGSGAMTLVGPLYSSGGSCGLLQDLDGDGDLDDLVRVGSSVDLLLNNGTGHFNLNVAIGPSGSITSLYADRMDMDGDGDLDLVIGGVNAQTGWYPNLGGGNYGVQHTIPLFIGVPYCGDADGDGDTDLMAFGASPGIRWWNNDGLGNLTLMDTLSTSTALPDAIGDLDGDGDVDWSVGTGTNCNVHLMFNASGASVSEGAVEDFGGYNLVGTSYAAGDIDGDGRTDLLACHGLGIAMWYGNQGNGTLSARHELSRTLCGAYDVAATDLDGDGDLDLVSASYYGDIVATYENLGGGNFGPQHVIVEHLNTVSGLFTGDIDNDGDPDVLTNRTAAALLRNQGGGNWSVGPLPNNNIPRALVDLDGDHDLDIVCNAAAWLMNDGSGNFTEVAEPLFASGGKVLSGDVNGDGISDLLFASNPFHAMISDGAGHFTDVASAVGIPYGDTDLGDLDGDGDLDVASIQYAGTYELWFRNNGSGVFEQDTAFANAPNGGRAILARDINGDGSVDLIWARSEGYTHRTYLNLNNGDGTFGPIITVDPSAESTAKLILADVNGDAVEDLVEARFHTLAWQENHFFDRFRVRGDVFKDFDQDGLRGPQDAALPFLPMRSSPPTEVLTWTNSYGGFDQPVDSGVTYQLWPQLPPQFTVTSDPDTAIVEANTNEPIVDSLLFGAGPIGLADNVVVNVGNAPFRCTSDRDIHISLRNLGSFIPTSILVDVELISGLTIIGAEPAADSIVGPHVYWNIDSLIWFSNEELRVDVHTGAAGQIGRYTTHVTAANTAQVWDTDYSAPISCAFDPNDKEVQPKGYGVYGAVPIDIDWLTYTIHFQNVGTDTALNVTVIDRLSDQLDWSSMEVIGASHPLTRVQIEEDGELTFGFDHIMLPHSAADAVGSNGFVVFRIRPKAERPSGTEVPNVAEIYFDYNAPVITNSTLNTLIDCALYTTTISSDDGSLLHASEGEHYQWFLDGDSIAGATSADLLVEGHGDYTVQSTSVYGCVAVSDPFQVISTGIEGAASFDVAVVPNPATTLIRVVANDVLSPEDVITLVDLNGRVLRTLRGTGTREVSIEREQLPAGLYVVRTVRGDRTIAVARVVLQ